MNDLISRQAAIDAVVSAMIDGADAELVEGIMELLPSAQPERKKGKWMSVSDETQTWHYCSECHYQQYEKTKFCPSCGADMRTEGNDDN